MAIHLIHTGDWHLAKPFGRFDAEKAPLLRDARTKIVDRVAELARRVGAEYVLVAGDVFDGPMVADQVLRRLAGRLEQYQDLKWHFLPGNHDPSAPNGVWQRFQKCISGDHVVIHHEAGLHHLSDGVDLLAAPLHARAISHDPTEWMVARTSDNGAIRIGLAHGAVQGFGSAGEASVLIAPDRAVSAGLDYLALGDWHGVRQAGPKAWYAGTPEPDQFPDNEPGYALSVQIDNRGAEPRVERHRLGQYHWQRHTFEGGDLMAAVAELEKSLSSGSVDSASTLLRVQFAGRIALTQEIELRDRVDRLSDLTFHTEADFDQLVIDADGLTQETFSDPLLAAVGERLSASMAAADDSSNEVAHQALLLLARYARDQEDAA